MMRRIFNLVLLLPFLALPLSSFATTSQSDKPRLLILTDIGGDPDDIQSLRRLLLYANEFRIEGLIATATHGPKGHRQVGVYTTMEHHIYEAIDDYEKVVDNLSRHRDGYPSAARLRSLVKTGQPERGVLNLSPGRSTEGSRHIIETVDASEEVLNIAVWGGSHDLAQALLDVKTDRKPDEANRFVSKIRVYSIGDQDRKYYPEKGTGQWIVETFPDIFYVEAGPPWILRPNSSAGYRGMYQNDEVVGSDLRPLVKEGMDMNQEKWVEENILKWGVLGENYPPSVGLLPRLGRNTRGVKEGDTPSWFYFLPNGLSDPAHPEWGGWGGRFDHLSHERYTDAQDDHWSGDPDGGMRRKWAVARWREAYQNDFAARIRWCVLSREEANHNPVAIIDGDDSQNVLIRKVSRGASLKVDASQSRDPDGDAISFWWWIYHEASSSFVSLRNEERKTARISIPTSAPNGEVHLVLEVTDNGAPKLVSYRRVILKIVH